MLLVRLTPCILFALVSTAAFPRPSTLSMTCRQAQSLVASKGAVVMTTGAHTYNQFVTHQSYCMTAEWGYAATAPTKDMPSCQLGYTCSTEPRGSD